ncbi:hypothetical protein [Xylophilus sp. ASV27]|uniref:hypothetical protein n=1 Tax=Xylophilus sp. ASV27 TaxID=2795129 RepID=UPI0018EC761D|nr:hypothetical protein [Xylophilus sp. ASV27]
MSSTGAGGLPDRIEAPCLAAPIFFHAVRRHVDFEQKEPEAQVNPGLLATQ